MRALIRGFRTWRAGRLGLDDADRLVAGDRSGPAGPGLGHLLDAVRAPATPGELRGEQAMAAALAAERRRATTPATRPRVRTRTLVTPAAAMVAVLAAGGTGVAAQAGNLPAGMQQKAHRLFSGLGVPAADVPEPAAKPLPSPAATPEPARTPGPGSSPAVTSPAASGSAVSSSPATSPPTSGPAVTGSAATASRAAWCAAWQTAEAGGKPMNGRDRRDLVAAAGGADAVAEYCGAAPASPSASPSGKTKPSKTAKAKESKKPHPTVSARKKGAGT